MRKLSHTGFALIYSTRKPRILFGYIKEYLKIGANMNEFEAECDSSRLQKLPTHGNRNKISQHNREPMSMEGFKFEEPTAKSIVETRQVPINLNMYHLKYDCIYGDHKLKISGKNEINRLSTDLKNINRMLKVGKGCVPPLERQDKGLFSIKKSKNIFALDLSAERETGLSFPLLRIPVELFEMVQLVRLHLDCNRIRSIPDQFGFELKNLEILTLSNNNIKWLPMSLSNLKSLKSIHLSHNKFDLFPFVLCCLQTLRFLDISSNYLYDIPCEIENLIQLESLLLFQNSLQSIPKSIGNLRNLRTLWLGSNQLLRLPAEICDIPNLDWTCDNFDLSSNIDKNPLVDPPMGICLKGICSIREYFEKKYDASMKSAAFTDDNFQSNHIQTIVEEEACED
jgi:hypothetical protein